MTSLTYAAVETAERLVAKYGYKEAGSRIGLALDIGPSPSPDEIAAVIEGHAAIRIVLEP